MTVNLSARTRTVVLLQGEDEERLDLLRNTAVELRQKADRLKPKPGRQQAPTGLLGDDDDWTSAEDAAVAAEQAADDFAAEAEPRGVKVVMRSLGRKRWREITGKYPPREGHDGDAACRYNIDEAPDEIVPACLASPALNDADLEAFLDGLSDGQFDLLAGVAHTLNKGLGADPTQRLLSVSSQTSSATSSSPSAPE